MKDSKGWNASDDNGEDTKKLEWFNVDEASMSSALKAKYRALQKAREAEKQAKTEFEAAFIVEARNKEILGTKFSLAFGYRFGKLSVARIDKEAKKVPATTKPKFSF